MWARNLNKQDLNQPQPVHDWELSSKSYALTWPPKNIINMEVHDTNISS